MGLFFQSNTWRAPLQLIDCWLPEPTNKSVIAHSTNDQPQLSNTQIRFARAGWLGRPAANTLQANAVHPRARVIRSQGRVLCGDGRVVVAGRVDEVCAALEQLAARDEADRRRQAA